MEVARQKVREALTREPFDKAERFADAQHEA